NCRALRTTEPMVVPSLKAGIATRTFDSGKTRRKTAGTAVDASLSMFLATRQRGRRQGSQCFPPSPGRRNPGYKSFANIFKVGRKHKSFSLPVVHIWESYPGRWMSEVLLPPSRLQVYATPHISRAHRHGYIPFEPMYECPRVFALEEWDLGRFGGQADVIEIYPHHRERAVESKAIPPAAADPQRPPAGHGP